MKKNKLKWCFICAVTLALLVVTQVAPFSEAYTYPGNQYLAWNRYYQSAYGFRYWYNSANPYGATIARQLATSYEYGYRTYLAAGQVLGRYYKKSIFDVLVDPVKGYTGYSGYYKYYYSTRGITNELIYMRSGEKIDTRSMYNWGIALSHEFSHMIFANATKCYANSSIYNKSDQDYRRSALTEALAYYTGSVYYPPTAYKMSVTTIKNNVKGYVFLPEDAARRYPNNGFTTKDWYLFHAFGYYLAATKGISLVLNRLTQYNTGTTDQKYNSFKYAYQNTYVTSGTNHVLWADRYPYTAAYQKTNSRYLYYYVYRMWNS